MGRTPCCDKSNVKKGLWTAEEDAKILAYVSEHGTSNWTSAPRKAGLKRCGKSCRLRWTNYLRPDLKHDRLTPEEEMLIINLHAVIGSRWSQIAAHLPGRTDNDVKNYWNTKLKKKLLEMGIDPVTHKPFSQILTDYENIAHFPKAITQIGSFNRDLRNTFMSKPEVSSALEVNLSSLLSHSMVAMRTPMMESVQDGLINGERSNNNCSWDLQYQLQAMGLFKEATNCTNLETFHPHFFSEGSSSSSSSTATAMQVTWPIPFACEEQSLLQTTPGPPISWNEFFLKDAFLPLDQQQWQEQQDIQGLLSTGSSSEIQVHDEIQKIELIDEGNKNYTVEQVGYDPFTDIGKSYPGTVGDEAGKIFEGSLCPNDSFMESIFDQDNQISWEFPSNLGEPF
ncbi:hypothetical protein NE237_021583 [Protea cynaroides]|uniref:Transcription factor MYB35 n=1 Tax=Protea cynaroides TaxID=273540 RepID=A0A9Q0HBH1_9MAGN|nr:hypothetical protein NE237_021583 [Protea cynaroides]